MVCLFNRLVEEVVALPDRYVFGPPDDRLLLRTRQAHDRGVFLRAYLPEKYGVRG